MEPEALLDGAVGYEEDNVIPLVTERATAAAWRWRWRLAHLDAIGQSPLLVARIRPWKLNPGLAELSPMGK